ncbi:flavin reductase family protein [Labrys wisconsinensis]|uniref:Flavin reductase (DIM6/NTAB) family NADH-FMN oxidoreductase RutF n=1 Tax=Labrys wisconsinensis TaxID=425677 RepID=A0ABU0JKD5_9HYPH|nr:flavin reductase family protein [Labrys wisconsinensis]MDQ0473941.1 flavin reductase (DIM6/NTAB) family NADH-FMN oxidoreductase RutF [Labrys wisconsinensis]
MQDKQKKAAAVGTVAAPARPIDARHFRTVLGNVPTGVVAVTATGSEQEPVGMIVGSFTSVSLNPPLVSFLADSLSSTQAKLQAAGRFCVNVLAADQERLCRKLAARGSARFDGVRWAPSALGNPVIEGIVAWIDCTIDTVIEIGDHHLIVGRVRELHTVSDRTPLLFFRGSYGDYLSNADRLLDRLLDWR